jgi:sulfur-carrier protein
MAQLRLFASIREAAGTAKAEIDGGTVGEVIAAATERYGPRFAELLGTCRVWRNGEPALEDDPVGPNDEVALLPPVSGGAGALGTTL